MVLANMIMVCTAAMLMQISKGKAKRHQRIHFSMKSALLLSPPPIIFLMDGASHSEKYIKKQAEKRKSETEK